MMARAKIIITMQSGQKFEFNGPEAVKLNRQLPALDSVETAFGGDYPGELTICTKFVESFIYYPFGQRSLDDGCSCPDCKAVADA